MFFSGFTSHLTVACKLSSSHSINHKSIQYQCCLNALHQPCWKITGWNPGRSIIFVGNMKMSFKSRGERRRVPWATLHCWRSWQVWGFFTLALTEFLSHSKVQIFCRKCFPSRNIKWLKGWCFLHFLSYFSQVDKCKNPLWCWHCECSSWGHCQSGIITPVTHSWTLASFIP